MRLVTNILGTFVYKGEKLIKKHVFEGGPKDVAKKLAETEYGYLAEEKKLLQELVATGTKKVKVRNPSRFRGLGLDVDFMEDETRTTAYDVAHSIGVSAEDVRGLTKTVNRLMVRASLKEVDRDQLIIQAVNSLDDIDEAVNRLVERLREWHGLHFPEMDTLVESNDIYSRLVDEFGDRTVLKDQNLGLDPAQETKLKNSAKDSLGVDFSDADLGGVKDLAQPIVMLYEKKKSIGDYIEAAMEDFAPNISYLAGPLLGARLISLAHGLDRLSKLPAGTIQMLGAEDAFFRFLKTGKKPPKHGIIFQYPAIRGAKRDIRGKLARTLAAKIAIASRADAFHGNFIAEKLKKDFDSRIASLTKD